MKKTYISPATRTVKINVQLMLPASNLLMGGTVDDTGELLSRQRTSRFDDDWFDDEDDF